MLQYHPLDLTKILESRKLHWILKANLITEFVAQKGGNTKIAADALGKSNHFITDCCLLSKYCKRFPKLHELELKNTALDLIRKYKKDEVLLRTKIQERILYERISHTVEFAPKREEFEISQENRDDESNTHVA